MNEQLPFLVSPYAALAPVYNRAGFNEYAHHAVLRYLSYVQSLDWAGRRILDLGCGTGMTTWLLGMQGYRVAGIDNNPHMLAVAREASIASSDEVLAQPEFIEMDVRALESPMGPVDLVLAVGNTLNAIQSLRELEIAFAKIAGVLDNGRLFAFDMLTIRGLAMQIGDRDCVAYDNGHDLMVLVRHQFSYETLSNTSHYIIYRQDDDAWFRQDELHVARGYPTQGIVAMLERAGFELVSMLDPDMRLFDTQRDSHGRVVFFARKRA